MNDAARRAAFRAYFERNLEGDRAAFMRRTKYTKGRLNQFLDDDQPFGERAATNVARKLGLAPDYFLRGADRTEVEAQNAAPALSLEESDLLRLWRPLLSDQREILMAELQRQHAIALKTIEEVRQRGYGSNAAENVLPREFTRPAQRELPKLETAPAPGPKRRRK